jgi:hypothetical protein
MADSSKSRSDRMDLNPSIDRRLIVSLIRYARELNRTSVPPRYRVSKGQLICPKHSSRVGSHRRRRQYSPLITKYDPRMTPANFDFCLANLNRDANSDGTSIPSESLNPTARFFGSSMVYITLIARPLS